MKFLHNRWITFSKKLKNSYTISKFLIFVLLAGSFLLWPSVANAATFTVDSTGDQADLSTNGLCATSLGTCTLRAAITEAAAAAGPHTINFNIPTSDAGYLDFDGGAGDSNGDDSWIITPATALPTISTNSVTINGATQTSNQGNFNTNAPEIAIDGHTAGAVRGLYFTGTNGSVNSLTLYRFGSANAAIEVTGDGFTITNSMLGPYATGLTSAATTDRNGYGLLFTTASGTVGSSTSDGNVFAGNHLAGVYASCGTGGTGKTVNIAGNKFGLGIDGSTAIVNGSTGAGETTPTGNAGLFLVNDCLSTIGGDTSSKRNTFGGDRYGIVTNLGTSNLADVDIYNNFFGTATNGTTNRAHTWAIHNIGTANLNDVITLQIGDSGKGNLFRYSAAHVRMTTSRREFIAAYNTFSDSTAETFWVGTTTVTLNISKIHHNHFGRGTPDPYFGLTTGGNAQINLYVTGTTTGLEIYENDFISGLSGYWGHPQVTASIAGTTFHDNYSLDSITTAFSIGSSAGNNIVENNTIVNSVGGMGVAGFATIRNNNIDGEPTKIAEWEGLASSTGLNSTLIENNTVTDFDNGIVIRAAGRIVQNNTVNGSNHAIWVPGGYSSATTGSKFRNNVLTNVGVRPVEISTGFTWNGRGANDAGDVDTGASQLMNYPEIQTVEYLGGGEYRINGRLDGNTAEDPMEIEICLAEDNVDGTGSCDEPLGVATTANTPDQVSGASNYYNWTLDVSVDGANGLEGSRFTGIATNVNSWTSEFATSFEAVTSNSNYTLPTYEFVAVDPADNSEIDELSPLLDWDEPTDDGYTNDEIDHYDIIVDSVVIDSTDDGETSEYQITEPLEEGVHIWQVIAYRNEDIVMGQTEETEFTLEVPDPTLVSPIDGIEIEDTTPLLDWTDTNTEVDHYDVLIDDIVVGTVDDTATEYQVITELSEAAHTWQVKSYRSGDILVGPSEIESFIVNLPETSLEPEAIDDKVYEFDLLDPIDGETVTTGTPKLDWENIDSESDIDFYDVYINNKFIENTAKISEYQIPETHALANGLYNWQVFAYKRVDGEAIEIAHTTIESFTVAVPAPEGPIKPPQTGGEKPNKPPVREEVPPKIPIISYLFDLSTTRGKVTAASTSVVAVTGLALSINYLPILEPVKARISALILGLATVSRRFFFFKNKKKKQTGN